MIVEACEDNSITREVGGEPPNNQIAGGSARGERDKFAYRAVAASALWYARVASRAYL